MEVKRGMSMTQEVEDTARRLAEQHGLRFVDLTKSALAPGAAALLPEAVARRHHVVPIGRRLGTPVIAVSDPGDLFAMDALRASIGREFVAVVASADQVARALKELYSPGDVDSDDVVAGLGVESEPSSAGSDVDDVGNEVVADAGAAVEDIAGAEPEIEAGQVIESPDIAEDGELIDEVGQPTSLEDSLREVLSPPPSDSPFFPPLPAPGAYQPVEPEGMTGNGSAPLAGSEEVSSGDDTGEDLDAESAALPPVPAGYTMAEAEDSSSQIFYGPPLARVLVEAGRVSPEEMSRALQAHQETGESLARFLFNQGLAKEEDLVWAMAQEVGLEFVDLNSFPIDQGAATLIPAATARHHMVIPIKFEDGVPVVAMANPTDVFAMDDLRTIMGRNFTPVVATRTQIATLLRYAQDTSVDVEDVAQDAAGDATTASEFELESLQAVVEDAPIVRYVNLLILQALNERASDIHIEPTPRNLRIRFRIDGVMHDATTASASIANAVVSRLKVLGEMDITEHRVPQEGRVSLSVSERQIDLRIAVLPSIYGETVVMRLLDKSASLRSLPELGFFPDTLERYAKSYNHPYGVILVTGPTGAGKTTTLYATLLELLSPEKSVVTVEDPVEYRIDGITQVQINTKAGLLFQTALKSILRADPDIVLIGEIRSTETATIAMEAALSGHLVLSTVHTNTAAATPLRLTEMGIEPFLVTSAIGGVLTQRLARTLCEQCKEPTEASEKDFLAAGYREEDLEGVDTSTLYKTVGCRHCSHTGYLGRMVLAEVMEMTEEIDRMIIEQASIVDIERMAVDQGMRTLRRDGLLKAVAGQTTLEEVLRVVV
ncbi:MAG: GspE/PulE family protein [Acidimicrobiales bacterium]